MHHNDVVHFRQLKRCGIKTTVERMYGKSHTAAAFTLIELLLVIGIIAVLASIVIVAVNPQQQLLSARDAERNSEANTVQNAINQYYLDNESFPGDKTWTTTRANALDICAPGVTDASCINIEDDLVPTYLAAIPVDSAESDPLLSGYAGYQTTTDGAFLVAGLRILVFAKNLGSVQSGYGG